MRRTADQTLRFRPSPGWLHEIKHDGFRILARRDSEGQQTSIVLNEVYEEDGAIVFREACKLGCEGIISKRLGSTYRRGRSPYWVKVKNPNAPAVKRDWER